jgi:hypothetical protein
VVAETFSSLLSISYGLQNFFDHLFSYHLALKRLFSITSSPNLVGPLIKEKKIYIIKKISLTSSPNHIVPKILSSPTFPTHMITKTSFIASSPHHVALKNFFITFVPQSRACYQLDSSQLFHSAKQICHIPLATYYLLYISQKHPANIHLP